MLLFIIDTSNPALLASWGFSQWLNSLMITGHLLSIESIHLGILKRWLVCLDTKDQYRRAAVAPVMTNLVTALFILLGWFLILKSWLFWGVLISFLLHFIPIIIGLNSHVFIYFLASVALETAFLVGCGLSVSLSSF